MDRNNNTSGRRPVRRSVQGSARVRATGASPRQGRSVAPDQQAAQQQQAQQVAQQQAQRAAQQPVQQAGVRPTRPRTAQQAGAYRQQTAQRNPGAPQGYATMRPAAARQDARAYSRNVSSYSGRKKKRMSTGKKVAIGVASFLAVLLVVGGAAAFLFIDQINANLRSRYTAQENLEIQEKLVPVQDVNEPFYIMLIGSDIREGDAASDARSDTAIVTRVDPVTWTVTMISIPRDTKIVYRGSTMKFNSVYSYGKAAGVIESASNLCGVDINHYAEIDFTGLIKMVDAVGGVEVDVPQPINDPDAGTATIDEAGLQTLNGDQALVFARSRHYYLDGDFSRSGAQRALIEAIFKKVLALPVGDIPAAVQTLSKCVSTDFSVNQIYSLAMQYKNSGKELTVYSAMVPSIMSEEDGGAYVITDHAALSDMMKIVEAGGDPNTVELSGNSLIGGSFTHYDYQYVWHDDEDL